MAEQRERMSRAARTARGSLGAMIATLFAAASHSLAGGEMTPLAVAATAILALPLCVALAGRVGSLWRLALAVCLSQFVYHWSFAGLGAATGSASEGAAARLGDLATAAGPHAAHLGTALFDPSSTAAALGSSALMWASHAAAAVFTIALLHRGEQASIELTRRFLRTVLPELRPVRLPDPAPRVARPRVFSGPPLAERLFCPAAITHRGPPAHA